MPGGTSRWAGTSCLEAHWAQELRTETPVNMGYQLHILVALSSSVDKKVVKLQDSLSATTNPLQGGDAGRRTAFLLHSTRQRSSPLLSRAGPCHGVLTGCDSLCSLHSWPQILSVLLPQLFPSAGHRHTPPPQALLHFYGLKNLRLNFN